jgi:hypothetical protein
MWGTGAYFFYASAQYQISCGERLTRRAERLEFPDCQQAHKPPANQSLRSNFREFHAETTQITSPDVFPRVDGARKMSAPRRKHASERPQKQKDDRACQDGRRR